MVPLAIQSKELLPGLKIKEMANLEENTKTKLGSAEAELNLQWNFRFGSYWGRPIIATE